MKEVLNKGLKIIFSLCIVIFVGWSFFLCGLKPYCHYKDYHYQNDFSEESVSKLDTVKKISQSFIAKGNILNSISLYLTDNPAQTINIAVLDQNGKEIIADDIILDSYNANEWNKIAFNSKKLKRNKQYSLVITSEYDLSALLLDLEESPIIFMDCKGDDDDINGTLAVGFQFTYSYLTLGNAFELMIRLLFALFMVLAACYAICNFELLYGSFIDGQKRRGLLYAVYFSVSFVFIYNPLEPLRNEVSKFHRVIGTGLASNVDVSKRIRNFNCWFILFVIVFVLFYLLANHLIQQQKSEDKSKIISFTDNFMVLADCNLLLRCITYFSDMSSPDTMYCFSSDIIMLIVTVMIAYIILKLDKNVSYDEFSKLLLIAASVSYPIAIFTALELENGKAVLGVMAVCFVSVLLFCKYAGKAVNSNRYKYIAVSSVLVFSMFPLWRSDMGCYMYYERYQSNEQAYGIFDDKPIQSKLGICRYR